MICKFMFESIDGTETIENVQISRLHILRRVLIPASQIYLCASYIKLFDSIAAITDNLLGLFKMSMSILHE